MCGLSSTGLFAQSSVATIDKPAKLTIERGQVAVGKITVALRAGYHCNSNTPSDTYLIPLKLTWSPGALESVEIIYPPPKMEKYAFSPKPLSVYSGEFVIATRFKAPAQAPSGDSIEQGKLRYQACTDQLCLPPRTIEVALPVHVD